MAAEGYLQRRRWNQDISGNIRSTAATTTTTLVTNVRPLTDTIFIQRLHLEVTTGAAQTWTFGDSTPLDLVPAVSVAAIAHFDFDFGPDGMPLAQGKNFLLTISAAGAVANCTWEGYQKRTVVAAA